MNDAPDFAKLLALLSGKKVDFIVVGGVAVGFNGFVRTTEDLDILIEASGENIRRLAGALAHFGEGYGGAVTEADFPMEPGAVRIAEQDCPLDISWKCPEKPIQICSQTPWLPLLASLLSPSVT
jgi:hypothetical protein